MLENLGGWNRSNSQQGWSMFLLLPHRHCRFTLEEKNRSRIWHTEMKRKTKARSHWEKKGSTTVIYISTWWEKEADTHTGRDVLHRSTALNPNVWEEEWHHWDYRKRIKRRMKWELKLQPSNWITDLLMREKSLSLLLEIIHFFLGKARTWMVLGRPSCGSSSSSISLWFKAEQTTGEQVSFLILRLISSCQMCSSLDSSLLELRSQKNLNWSVLCTLHTQTRAGIRG